MKKITFIIAFVAVAGVQAQNIKTEINQQFKDYWYSGKAEVSSYELEQARYGEIRKGHAVHIFVTEPFSKKHNTKADTDAPENMSVLKLNATKKFNTGVYPYSIMTSSFLPVNNPKASLKISSSTQEWCGHEYIELTKTKENFELINLSYFQGDSFRDKHISKNIVLEDDVWSIIRLTPRALPQGNFKALPSFVYSRFSHKEVKAYTAKAVLTTGEENSVYEIKYPELERSLKITFQNKFPYQITGWTETFYSGWGVNRKLLTTKAVLKKTLNIAYWQANSNKDAYLRKELRLE